MGTPKLSSVRQGPSSNHQHHEGFHLPLPRGRRHGRGRSPVPLRQLLPQHLHNYGYSGLYNHGIYSGIHTYGKREAEAEPWRSYYGGYSGYRPYSGYGHGGFGGYRGYRGWY